MAAALSDGDILVIGGGITGAAIAYDLANHGLGPRVRVLERGQPGGGATARAAALVTVVRDDPVQMALAQQTLRLIERLMHDHGAHFGWRPVGALHVAPESQAAALRQRAALAAAHGVACEWLGHDAAQARAPWLAADAFDRALYFPHDGYLEPWGLAQACLRAATSLGARVEVAEVRRIVVDGGRVVGVERADGTRTPAAAVVLASGAWANRLSLNLDLPLPIAPVRSQYWISDPALRCPRDGAVVLMPAIRAYARPEAGALLFGLREVQPTVADARLLPDDLAGFDFNPGDPGGWNDLAEGAEALARYVPALRTGGIAHHIAGPSTYTPDGQPVLGTAPGIAGLVVATGCNGSGISLAGGIGRLAGALVRGEAPWVDASAMAPARRGQFDPHAPELLRACAATRSRKTSG